jgi:hypothetical protein
MHRAHAAMWQQEFDMRKLLLAGGLLSGALLVSAPASAQLGFFFGGDGYDNGYNYGYGQPYGYRYGQPYGYGGGPYYSGRSVYRDNDVDRAWRRYRRSTDNPYN